MADVKTKPTARSAKEFLETVDVKKRDDALSLLEMFERATGERAVMWGTGIVGFGKYLVPSGKGFNEWPLVGFSPRKQGLTLYIGGAKGREDEFGKLGKCKVSGSCLHIKKLSDVDAAVLERLVGRSFRHHKERLA